MSRTGWIQIFSIISLQCLVFPLANANHAGFCFSSSFSRAIGYILRGFLLGEVEVSSVIECKKRCVVSANCLSLNILTNSDRNLVCQLNSDRKENGVKEQFVQHGAGEYYGLKVHLGFLLVFSFPNLFRHRIYICLSLVLTIVT